MFHDQHLARLSDLCKRHYVDQPHLMRALFQRKIRGGDMTETRTKNPKFVAVGLRIGKKRRDKGLSQVQLALELGVSLGLVGQYEVGTTGPTIKRLEALAMVLGTTVEWLLTGNDPDELIRAQTVREKEGLSLIRKLPADKQDSALAMLRGLASDNTEP